MIKKTLAIFICCWFSITGIASEYLKTRFNPPQEYPEERLNRNYLEYKYALDSMYYHSSFMNEYSNSNYKSFVKNLKDLRKSAYYSAIYKNRSIDEGKVYYSWPEAENLVKQILKKIQPDVYKNEDSIRVSITRQGSWNASAMDINEIFVNVGLLAHVSSEDELAFVIGHEIGHIINEDMLRRLIYTSNLSRKYLNPNRLFGKNRSKYASKASVFSQKGESRADSIAYSLVHKAGYNVHAAKTALNYIRSTEVNYQSKLKNSDLRKMYYSHPSSDQRLAYCDYFIKEFKVPNKKLSRSKKFSELQKEAIQESLYNYRKDGLFFEYLELATVFYLQNPLNENYHFHVLEGLRLVMSIYPEWKNSSFITNRFRRSPNGKKDFDFIDALSMFVIDSNAIKKNSDIVRDRNKIKTYQEAFDWFAQQAEKRVLTECYFSLGLRNLREDKSKAEDYLKLYISTSGAKYKTEAEYFLAGQVISNSKNYIAWNSIEWSGYIGSFMLYNNQSRYSQYYSYIFKQQLQPKVPEKELLFLNDYKFQHYKDYVDLRDHCENIYYLSILIHNKDEELFNKSLISPSPLWLWPENLDIYEKYGLGNLVLLNEHRSFVKANTVVVVKSAEGKQRYNGNNKSDKYYVNYFGINCAADGIANMNSKIFSIKKKYNSQKKIANSKKAGNAILNKTQKL